MRFLQAVDGQPWLRVHRVALGSPAAAYWSERMLPLMGKKFDEGEAETIALCAQRRNRIFVTRDVVPTFVALAELGPGRVVLPFDLWRWLLAHGLIEPAQFGALCRQTYEGLKQRLPGIPARLSD